MAPPRCVSKGNSNTYSDTGWGNLLTVYYKYDPYGNAIYAGGSHANINPLHYRGYVYDTDTGFYYLQSRYYDPKVGRFINADAYASTGQGVVGNNMFAYCLNNPVNYSDFAGEDAIWIQEKGSAGTFGHSGLLVQNAKGEWFFFYWGAKPGASAGEMIMGTEALMVFAKVDTDGLDMRNEDHVRTALQQTNDYFGDDPRSGKVTDLQYFEGDYSTTHTYLHDMHNSSTKEQYSVVYRNCLQQTRKALAKSNKAILFMATSAIPNLAYKELYIWNELLD